MRRLPWQEVAWSLMGGAPWRSEWGPGPSCMVRTLIVVCANRVGKSTFAGQVLGAHVTGRLARWQRPGEVWGGMPTLQKSVETMRPMTAAWLGSADKPRWTPGEANAPSESFLRTGAGWKLRLKAYEQGRTHWYAGKCQAVVLDEPPPDEIVTEARTRLIDEEGVLLCVFTPLEGTSSLLYTECYQPWLEYQQRHPQAKWGEVTPGTWVISVGMRDNAKSVGGWLPDAAIEAKERELIEGGRQLEARVAVHGEWLEISEDRIIPVERWQDWSVDPPGGFIRLAAWIDGAVSTSTSACRSSIAVAGIAGDGRVYLLDSEGGKWDASEREQRFLDVLKRWGDPNCYVQNTTTDTGGVRDPVNMAMRRAGRRACVQEWPPTGQTGPNKATKVTDKVTRAHAFAPMVASGQVLIRPEHVEVKRQAAVFSAAYLKAKGLCDDLDAAMGACMVLLDSTPSDAPWHAMEEARVRPMRQHSDRDDGLDDDTEPFEDWRLPDSLLGTD